MNYHDVSASPSYPAASFKLLSAAAESNNGLSNFVNLYFFRITNSVMTNPMAQIFFLFFILIRFVRFYISNWIASSLVVD